MTEPVPVADILAAVDNVNRAVVAFVQVHTCVDVDADAKMEIADALNALTDVLRSLDRNIENVSDGYHTFRELYDHRIELFLALARMHSLCDPARVVPDLHDTWRAELHSDGSRFDGWFIMGIGTRPGRQITYHLPMSRWADADFVDYSLDRAPTFDGHTSADVLARLREHR